MQDCHPGLCIGGPLDGRRINDHPDGRVVPQAAARGYRPFALPGAALQVWIWIYGDLSLDDALARLVALYPSGAASHAPEAG